VASSVSYIGWGEAPYGAGSWGVELIEVFVDGEQATASLGTVSLVTNNNLSVTGLSAAANVGSEDTSGDAIVEVVGVQASAVEGDARSSLTANAFPTGVFAGLNTPAVGNTTTGVGWGSNGWGEGTWDGGVIYVTPVGVAASTLIGQARQSQSVTLSGLSATAELNSVEIDAKATVLLTGERILVLLESGVAVDAGANHGVVGEAATIDIGEVSVIAKANIFPTGVEAANDEGTVAVKTVNNVFVTGVEGTGQLGEEEVSGKSTTGVSDVFALGFVGTAAVSAKAVVNVTGVVGTTGLGEAEISGDGNVVVTGVAGTISLGSVAISSDANVTLTGVSANGYVNYPLVWGIIDTSQTPNWVPIAA
jgi:hypothetical protein